jgi:hypothetical protein
LRILFQFFEYNCRAPNAASGLSDYFGAIEGEPEAVDAGEDRERNRSSAFGIMRPRLH